MVTKRHLGIWLLAILVLVLPAGRAAAERPFGHARLARAALAHHIQPGYARLRTAATGLKQSLASQCGAPSQRARALIEERFDQLIDAWGRIEDIQFGPITEALRLERMLFWPDRRGRGRRQVEQALEREDPDVTQLESLSRKSVALQGIGALEVVLFGSPRTSPQSLGAFPCRYAGAIADSLAGIAHELAAAWSDGGRFATLWLAPGPANPHFLSASETTLALAKALDHGLERIRDQRIAGPLGMNAERRRTPAVLALSQRTMRLIAANITGLRELYDAGGMRDAITRTAADPSVAGNAALVDRELATALERARRLVSAVDPFEQKGAAKRLIAMGFPLKNARMTATQLLSVTAGLAMGFNASDGD